jgi:hypothetical protein
MELDGAGAAAASPLDAVASADVYKTLAADEEHPRRQLLPPRRVA